METYLSLRKSNNSVACTEPSTNTALTQYTFYRKFAAKTTTNATLHEIIFKETVLTKFKPPKALMFNKLLFVKHYDNYYHHHFYLSYHLFFFFCFRSLGLIRNMLRRITRMALFFHFFFGCTCQKNSIKGGKKRCTSTAMSLMRLNTYRKMI